MSDDAVIILDPVNADVIRGALTKNIRAYIGGNCTVSLMLMAVSGLFRSGPRRVDNRDDVSSRFGSGRSEDARACETNGISD